MTVVDALDDVERRVPTLRLIVDADLRDEVARVTAGAPRYFWEAPATTSDEYHNPACRGHRGLWVHTLMLSTAIETLADSREQLDDLDRRDLDTAHAAAILHDQRKLGAPERRGEPSDTALTDHDLRMADYLTATADVPKRVVDAVASHMGPWYDGPAPVHPVSRLVHDADMIASSAAVTPAIQGPLPRELADLDVDLDVVYLD